MNNQQQHYPNDLEQITQAPQFLQKEGWINTNKGIITTLIIYASGAMGASSQSMKVIKGNLQQIISNNPYLCDRQQLTDEKSNRWLFTPQSISKKRVKYKIYQFNEIFHSSNSNLEHAKQIGRMIKENYQQFDTFMVIVGLDTLCYIASLVSFMFENLSKLIIFTGGSFPLSLMRNDSFNNLASAFSVVTQYILNDVLIVNEFSVLRANRSSRLYEGRLDSIVSPNFPPIIQIKINLILNQKILLKKPEQKWSYFDAFSEQIKILKYHPLMKKQTLQYQLKDPTIKAVIIQSYAAATLPQNNEILNIFKKAFEEKQTIFVNISQCTYYLNNSNIKQIFAQYNILFGGNMTIEACLAKLSYLIGKSYSYQKIVQLIKTDLRGQLNQIQVQQLKFDRPPESLLQIIESVISTDIKKNKIVIDKLILPTIVKQMSKNEKKKALIEYLSVQDKFYPKIFQIQEILAIAVKNDNLSLVRFYLDNDVNPNQLYKNKYSPLYIAFSNENRKIAHQLRKRGAIIVAPQEDILYLFMTKIKQDKVDFLQFAIHMSYKDKLQLIKNEQDKNLGHFCVIFNAINCLKFLKQKQLNFNFNLTDIYGYKPLDQAKRLDKKQIIKLLS